MKIEVLFPEICNLYGDPANVSYLARSLDNAVKVSDGKPIYDVEIVETHLTDNPLFIREQPDLIYMGTMTEKSQKLAIARLSRYKKELAEAIEKGYNFLLTGNAAEVFGNAIIEDDVEVARGLGLIDIEARRSSIDRYNSLYVGRFDCEGAGEIKVVGYKTTFGFIYGNDLEKKFLDTEVGYGSNLETTNEGIIINNLYATYLTGPLFPYNPLFMKWYMREKLGAECQPAFYDAALTAYYARLEEYTAPEKGWKY